MSRKKPDPKILADSASAPQFVTTADIKDMRASLVQSVVDIANFFFVYQENPEATPPALRALFDNFKEIDPAGVYNPLAEHFFATPEEERKHLIRSLRSSLEKHIDIKETIGGALESSDPQRQPTIDDVRYAVRLPMHYKNPTSSQANFTDEELFYNDACNLFHFIAALNNALVLPNDRSRIDVRSTPMDGNEKDVFCIYTYLSDKDTLLQLVKNFTPLDTYELGKSGHSMC